MLKYLIRILLIMQRLNNVMYSMLAVLRNKVAFITNFNTNTANIFFKKLNINFNP